MRATKTTFLNSLLLLWFLIWIFIFVGMIFVKNNVSISPFQNEAIVEQDESFETVTYEVI